MLAMEEKLNGLINFIKRGRKNHIMADTVDVAHVLFQWMFGKKPDPNFGILENYESPSECQGISDTDIVGKIEELVIRYRIGIEDARQLLRIQQEEQEDKN